MVEDNFINVTNHSINTIEVSDSIVFHSILTLSVIGFFILFFVVSYLPVREALLKEGFQDIKRLLTDPCYGFLKTLSSVRIIGLFLLGSILYLFSIVIAIVDYFYFKDRVILEVALGIDLISTSMVLITLVIILIRSKIVGKEDKNKIFAVVEELQWLKGEITKE